MELEQRCRLDEGAELREPVRTHEQRGQAEDDAIDGSEIGRPLPGAITGCGLAMPRSLAGANPAQVTASHGPGIEPCRHSGNGVFDA